MAIAATTGGSDGFDVKKFGVKKEMSRLWMKEDSFRRAVILWARHFLIYDSERRKNDR